MIQVDLNSLQWVLIARLVASYCSVRHSWVSQPSICFHLSSIGFVAAATYSSI